MADYQRVVEFLRDLRQAPLQSVTEEIAQVAKDYAKLCEEANERLRQCSAFLQQGLRSEALHFADEAPNLLDVVAALDLPDPQQWAEFCANNGLPVPALLALDRAGQINEAYAQEQPMEHLLAEHRRLALSRSPVRQRLHVMRQLASLDAGNATWEKDIRIFEKARIRELPSAFLGAVRERDEQTIRDLMTELTQTAWFEPPPDDLVTALSEAYNRMQRMNVETELHNLIPALRDAFAAQSVKECQVIVQRWKNIMTTAGVTAVSRELTDEIKPVIAWLADEDRKEERLRKFRASCKVFSEMLDAGAGDRELESAYAKLQEFHEEIPAELTDRYAAAKVERQKATERTHKMWLAVVGATVVVILAIGLGAFWYISHASAARAWANKIQRANTEHNIVLARQYITEQEKTAPGVSSDPAVAAAKRETESLEAEYAQALGKVRDSIIEIQALEKTYAATIANGSASIEEMLDAVKGLESGLAEVRAKGDLSWADTDKKLQIAEEHVQGILVTLRANVTTTMRQRIHDIAQQVELLPTRNVTIKEGILLLEGFASQLQHAKEMTGLDEQAKTDAATVLQKIEKARADLIMARDVATELQNVRLAATSADELKRALEKFVQKYPNAPQSADFATAISRTGYAKSFEAWRDLAVGFGARYSPASQGIAQRRLDAINAYIAFNPESPIMPVANACADYFKRAVDALGEKGTWQTSFADILATPIVSDLCYMEDTTGKRYYTLNDIHRVDRKINNQVSITFEAVNPKDMTKPITVYIEPPNKLVNERPQKVPHAKFATEMNDAIKLIDNSNWDTYGIDLVDRLAKASDIDVVVKAILIQKALMVNELVAGWALGDTYTKAQTELARQDPNSINWLDPDKVTEGTRKSLQATIAAIPPAATVKQLLAARKEALRQAVTPDVAGTGVLLKDAQGNWELSATGGTANGNEAGIFLPGPAAGQPGAALMLGTFTDGKIKLNDQTLHDVPQGTIVYIMKP